MAAQKIADITLEKKSGTVLTLKTNQKYVDNDVYFNIGTPTAVISGSSGSADVDVESTDSSSINGVNISGVIGEKATTEPSSGYFIRLKASGSVTPTVSQAGWIESGGIDPASATATKFFPVTGATVTQNAPTVNASGLVTATATTTAGYTPAQATAASNTLQLSTQGGATVTPTESEQTAVAAGKYTTGAVKVGAISSTYVGSGIPRKDSTDLEVSGDTVSVPAGYYATNASQSVAAGSVTQNAPTVNTTTGVVTATSTVTAGYVSADTKSNTLQLSTVNGSTIAPTESVQTAVAANKYTLGAVKIGAISSTYVGSGIARNDSDDLEASGDTVTVPAGYYEEDASKSVASGSATTPATTITSAPSISVGSDGLITASNSKTQSVTPTVSAGYVSSGTAGTITVSGSNTKQLTTQAAQTITPGTTDQTIASGTYLTGTQTIKGDADLTAANIKKGVEIFGVTGTFTTTPSGKSALTAAALRSGYAGFINGSQVNGSMPDATFANSATSGKTYTDISSSGPVLIAGDYLYINEGYTPYAKISLAKLVPDGSDVKGHGEYLLSGHSAYDNDGTLVAGTIQTLASTDVSISGKTVTIPVGKYTGASGSTAVSVSIDEGAVTTSFTGDGMSTYFSAGTSSDKNVTITPKYTNTAGYVAAHSTATNNGGTAYYKIKTVSGSIGGSASGGSATAAIANTNSMATISDISGKTAGTDYWQVKATATGAAGSYTPKYTVSTAGWIGSTVTGTAQSVSVSSDSTGQSIYIPKATFDKSGATVYCKTAGYIPAGSASAGVGTIGNGTVVASVSSNTGGSASIAATGFTASESATSYYVTLSTTAGSVKAKAVGGTSGYVTSSTTNETAATTVSVSGNGTKIYIPAGSASTNFTNSGLGTYFDSGTSSSYQVSITPRYSTTAGYVGAATNTNGTTSYYKIKGVSGSIGGSASGGSATAAISNVNSMNTIADVSGKTAGTDYWTVKATATGTAGSYTPKYTVSTAGWISSTVTGTAQSVSVSSDSTGKSIYIPKATFDKSGATVYCKTAGYIPAGSASAGVGTIGNGTVVASVSSNTGGSASMTATGFTPLASGTSDYYVTLTTSPGSVKAKAVGGTSGYVTSSTTNETAATNVAVSGNNTKIYIPVGGYSGSVSSHSITTTPVVTGSISGTVTNIGTTTKPSGTDGTNYWTITPGGSVTTTGVSTAKGKANISKAGYLPSGSNESAANTVNITPTVTNGTARYIVKGSPTNNTSGGTSSGTINRGKQIKIGAGYYPSDLYYTAQSNSGTMTISSTGTISVDGYANITTSGLYTMQQVYPVGSLYATESSTDNPATILGFGTWTKYAPTSLVWNDIKGTEWSSATTGVSNNVYVWKRTA